jgi:glycosyltransferase involved in cell wall biosynthesis
VTSAHISYNPRAVKEADALAAAGYNVRVVGLDREEVKRRLDSEVMSSRPWSYEVVDASLTSATGKARRFLSRLRAESYSALRFLEQMPGVMERAYSRYFPELVALACARPADLFVAHNLPALPAAAAAAIRANARLGFDAEDFHRGEFSDEPENARLLRQTTAIERKYIPVCDYVTAASDGIAAAYREALGIAPPTTILNVFPLSSRDAPIEEESLRRERSGQELSLYWYSQVIGPGRGLEVAVHALSLLGGKFSLALRGEWVPGYRAELMALAKRLGVDHLVRELASSAPEELVRRASLHDIGLASEMPDTFNRRIAVTNKLLVYLLAGIPAAVSDVPGQAKLIMGVAEAGFVYGARDGEALARGLASLAESPERLARAKSAARLAGESRYCWEAESPRLVDVVDGVLLGRATP